MADSISGTLAPCNVNTDPLYRVARRIQQPTDPAWGSSPDWRIGGASLYPCDVATARHQASADGPHAHVRSEPDNHYGQFNDLRYQPRRSLVGHLGRRLPWPSSRPGPASAVVSVLSCGCLLRAREGQGQSLRCLGIDAAPLPAAWFAEHPKRRRTPGCSGVPARTGRDRHPLTGPDTIQRVPDRPPGKCAVSPGLDQAHPCSARFRRRDGGNGR